MTDAELIPFFAIFNTLTKVFPFRADGDEARDISRAYFKTLQKYPLDLVKIGADNCMAEMERFPKPAEWKKHIPRRIPGPELPILTAAEEREWRHAETLGYQGECCGCNRCVEIGADTLPMRFVPLDPEEPAMMGDRRVLRGEWIHGEPLQSWYAARDHFWETFRASPMARGIVPPVISRRDTQSAIDAIFKTRSHTELIEREPGEEG